MYAQFDTVDPESDQHWIDKTEQAWKMFDKVSLECTTVSQIQPQVELFLTNINYSRTVTVS